MAYTLALSDQLNATTDNEPRKYPVDDHGKWRSQFAKVTQGAAIGDIGSQFELFDLPSGRLRVLPTLLQFRFSGVAMGAGRLVSLGHRAYYSTLNGAPNLVAEDLSAFAVGIDASAAAPTLRSGQGTPTNIKFDLYSRAGVRVVATVLIGTIPIGSIMEVLFPYLYE